MKKIIPLVLCAFAFTVTFVGCKKDPVKKKYRLQSLLIDSSSNGSFSYDDNGNLTQLVLANTTFNFRYDNNKLVARIKTGTGDDSVDSIYYDSQGRLYRTVSFDNTNTQTKFTEITYNSDNTVSTVIVDFAGITFDQLYEYVYNVDKLGMRTKNMDVNGSYKLSERLEFSGYDDKTNPLRAIYEKYLIDIQEIPSQFFAYPNNFTSVRNTTYDIDGFITGISSASASYTYNDAGLPVTATFTQGGSSGTFVFTYTEL